MVGIDPDLAGRGVIQLMLQEGTVSEEREAGCGPASRLFPTGLSLASLPT